MSRILIIALVSATLFAPIAVAGGLLPVNPVINGSFDVSSAVNPPAASRPALDHCVGVGHQATNPLYSSWGDWAIATVNAAAADPTTLVAAATGDAFADQATAYPVEHASAYAADPATLAGCDPRYSDIAWVNAWTTANDRGVGWSSDPGTRFFDYTGDGDAEVVIPKVRSEHSHTLWQSVATTTQAFSADFDAFTFRVEAGAIPSTANVQIGLGLSPGYMQHPWVGAFWEGAVLFTSSDMTVIDGRVTMDPVAQGQVICPAGYTPCLEYKAAYDAADAAGKRTLLGQARIVQTSFWQFNNAAGIVVLDDVAYDGAKSAAETAPNAGNV